MPTVLLTAFEPYDAWQENSSWLTLVEVTKQLPTVPRVTTRRYPVDLASTRERLAKDLAANYDYVLHLGQAPGSPHLRLEAIGLNVTESPDTASRDLPPLVPNGPLAYRSQFPLADWADKLRCAGIPCQVSFHAGTYLCNAMLYLSHHFAAEQRLRTRAALIHLPLDLSQTVNGAQPTPALPCATSAAAIRLILGELAGELA